ncbi:MAG: MmgE/PrpD family protein [Alphaproteobacteria bacterium]|nr:MmgE/PrpD family protein [Alphaproteobacteria bacterium]
MTRHTHGARTAALAEFVGGFTSGALPDPVLATTEMIVRDGVGCLLAAANPAFSTGRVISRFALDQGGRPEASVVGGGFLTSVTAATLANGTMGYACDMEPHHPEAILHPVAIMVPVGLALAERTGAGGAAFLGAVALGCEVEYRVSMAINPRAMYALGFHPSAVAGCFGAAAAASYLLRLSQEAVTRAFGLAACQASGMMAWEDYPTENARPFQMGMAARNGITAAMLAADGFGGPPAVFDQGHTVFRAFSRDPQPDHLVRDLGEAWDGITELAVKPYSSVSFLHPALDILFDLRKSQNLDAGSVKRITLRFPKAGAHCVDGNPLKSHCAQYILAVAMARGSVEVADIFQDRRLDDARVASLSERIDVVADEGELDRLFPDRYATVLEVEAVDGRRWAERNDIARGYPENPMSADELIGKFNKLAGSVVPEGRLAALRDELARLRTVASISRLAALMRAPAGTEVP